MLIESLTECAERAWLFCFGEGSAYPGSGREGYMVIPNLVGEGPLTQVMANAGTNSFLGTVLESNGFPQLLLGNMHMIEDSALPQPPGAAAPVLLPRNSSAQVNLSVQVTPTPVTEKPAADGASQIATVLPAASAAKPVPSVETVSISTATDEASSAVRPVKNGGVKFPLRSAKNTPVMPTQAANMAAQDPFVHTTPFPTPEPAKASEPVATATSAPSDTVSEASRNLTSDVMTAPPGPPEFEVGESPSVLRAPLSAGSSVQDSNVKADNSAAEKDDTGNALVTAPRTADSTPIQSQATGTTPNVLAASPIKETLQPEPVSEVESTSALKLSPIATAASSFAPEVMSSTTTGTAQSTASSTTSTASESPAASLPTSTAFVNVSSAIPNFNVNFVTVRAEDSQSSVPSTSSEPHQTSSSKPVISFFPGFIPGMNANEAPSIAPTFAPAQASQAASPAPAALVTPNVSPGQLQSVQPLPEPQKKAVSSQTVAPHMDATDFLKAPVPPTVQPHLPLGKILAPNTIETTLPSEPIRPQVSDLPHSADEQLLEDASSDSSVTQASTASDAATDQSTAASSSTTSRLVDSEKRKAAVTTPTAASSIIPSGLTAPGAQKGGPITATSEIEAIQADPQGEPQPFLGTGNTQPSTNPHTSSPIASQGWEALSVADSVHAAAQVARLSEQVGKSEMNVLVKADKLGAVEVHTQVKGDQVGATITVERHDAREALASDLSNLHQGLSERRLHLTDVTLYQGSLSSRTGNEESGSNLQQRDTASQQRNAPAWKTENPAPSIDVLAATEGTDRGAIFDSNGRLSVRA